MGHPATNPPAKPASRTTALRKVVAHIQLSGGRLFFSHRRRGPMGPFVPPRTFLLLSTPTQLEMSEGDFGLSPRLIKLTSHSGRSPSPPLRFLAR